MEVDGGIFWMGGGVSTFFMGDWSGWSGWECVEVYFGSVGVDGHFL